MVQEGLAAQSSHIPEAVRGLARAWLGSRAHSLDACSVAASQAVSGERFSPSLEHAHLPLPFLRVNPAHAQGDTMHEVGPTRKASADGDVVPEVTQTVTAIGHTQEDT